MSAAAGLPQTVLAALLAGERTRLPEGWAAQALGLQSNGDEAWLPLSIERLQISRVETLRSERSRRFWPGVQLLPQVASTNSHLLASREEQACTTEFQFGGRGRHGRAWLSPVARNVTVSVAWRSQRPVSSLGGLSLIVGLAVADALESCGVPGVKLKWPNDVLAETPQGLGKLAGILVELRPDADGALVIIGVGVNHGSAVFTRPRVDQPIADIAELAPAVSRNVLLAALLSAFADYLEGFAEAGLAPLLPAWQALHAYQGATVALLQAGGSVVTGVVQGVSEAGELCLRTATGEQQFNAGEVSLRPANYP